MCLFLTLLSLRGSLVSASGAPLRHGAQAPHCSQGSPQHRQSAEGMQARLPLLPGAGAQLPRCGMWDLPRPGIEPVSPALTDEFFTTEPPGKP